MRTEIFITDNLRIRRTSDNLQWVIEELKVTSMTDKKGNPRKNAGKPRWDSIGYYTKLSYAAIKCLNLITCDNDIHGETQIDLRNLIDRIGEAERKITKACCDK